MSQWAGKHVCLPSIEMSIDFGHRQAPQAWHSKFTVERNDHTASDGADLARKLCQVIVDLWCNAHASV